MKAILYSLAAMLFGAAVASSLVLILFDVETKTETPQTDIPKMQSVEKSDLSVDNGSDNPIIKVFQQIGERACIGKIKRTTDFFGFRESASAVIVPRPKGGVSSLLSLVMPASSPSGQGIVITDYSARADGECDATYEAVSYWPSSCQNVWEQKFRELRPLKVADSSFAALSGRDGLYVFMVPAGAGCISIKKESIN